MNREWKEKSLGEVIKLEYGKPLSKDKRTLSGKYPVYGANGEKNRTNEFYYDRKSIIVGRKGSAGEINLTEKRFWPLDVTYFVTFDDREYSLEFLYNLLLTLNLPKYAKGVKPGINRNEIYEIRVKIPSLPEQQRIVKVLDRIFKKIAKTKENTEKNLQNTRGLFESYLQSVFTNSGDGWEKKKLGEIIKLEYGKPLPDSKRKSDGVYPVYGANGEKDRSNEYYYDKYSIIVGRKGSAGEINLTEERFWPLDVTYFVTFDLKKHDLNFIYYILNNLKLSKLAKGVKPGINRNEVYSIDVHIPLLSEQKSIVAKLDALSAETKKLVAIYQQKLNDLEEFKKSILQKAFKGELIRVQL